MIKFGWRIWLLIIAIIFSVLAISPSFSHGVIVDYVDKNSSLYNEGLRIGEKVVSINGIGIQTYEDYTAAVGKIFDSNVTKRIDFKTDKDEYTVLTNPELGITVKDKPSTKIKTGLDIRGGARALVKPDANLTDSQMQDLIDISRNRFNIYGLSDIKLQAANDLEGNKYMLIEIAGATPADLHSLIAEQGKFEAKIGNTTVFEGGNKDITDVCRNKADCAGIDTCQQVQTGSFNCNFRFVIYLNEQAAERHAGITKNESLDPTGQYLADKLYLYVDGREVDSLFVSADLRGQVTTQIAISGPGTGTTEEEAFNNAKQNMNNLQTILLTGSLPYKLEIVKLDTISPVLGNDFTKAILDAGFLAILAVGIIVFARYRKIGATFAVLITSFSEIIIILGVAALIGWNLDLPSIAGILATIGTGVDQQIIILDEAKRKEQGSLSEKIKRALFIVFSSFFTSAVSLIPLFSAGAGFFKGFAITTLIGITSGVLISRPAFSEMIKRMEI
jgi:preprotein translocase subunit SecD